MPTLYMGETHRAYASLGDVSDDTGIDVFVSHKKEDAPKAREVATCIASYTLTAKKTTTHAIPVSRPPSP